MASLLRILRHHFSCRCSRCANFWSKVSSKGVRWFLYWELFWWSRSTRWKSLTCHCFDRLLCCSANCFTLFDLKAVFFMLEQHFWLACPGNVRAQGFGMSRSCWVNSRVVGSGDRNARLNLFPGLNRQPWIHRADTRVLLIVTSVIFNFLWESYECFFWEKGVRHHKFICSDELIGWLTD